MAQCFAASLMLLLAAWYLQRPAESCYDGLTIHAHWLPVEGFPDMLSNGSLVTLGGSPKTRSIVDENGRRIADVSEVTYLKCREEGACLLQVPDSQGPAVLVAYLRGGNVFRVLDSESAPFGVGSRNNRLEAFVSVATSDFPFGTKLYVQELAGALLPFNDAVHNGCVRVDDVNPDSCSIGFLAAYYAYFNQMRPILSGRIHAEVSNSCKTLTYV